MIWSSALGQWARLDKAKECFPGALSMLNSPLIEIATPVYFGLAQILRFLSRCHKISFLPSTDAGSAAEY